MTAFADAIPALILVLAIPVVAWWLSRRMRGSDQRRLKITDKATLGKGTWVAVVVVDGRRILVGAADQGVNMLTELSPEEPAAETTLDDESQQRPVTEVAHHTNGFDARPRIGLVRRAQLMTLRIPTGHQPMPRPFDASHR